MIQFKPIDAPPGFEAFNVHEDGAYLGTVSRYKKWDRWAASWERVTPDLLEYDYPTREDAVNLLQLWSRRYLSG